MRHGSVINVVIPALNEAEALPATLGAIPDWVDQIIVANNGSTDATAAVAAAGGATVVGEPCRGYGAACLAAMAAMSPCDVVVFLDADFSDDPARMADLVDPIADGRADMVLGSRIDRAEPGALTAPQRFGNALACRLMQALWRHRYQDLGPFRAISAAALRKLRMADRNYGWTVEMQIKALRMGLRVREVAVPYRNRIGDSKVSGTIRGMIGAGWKILWTIFRYAACPPPPAEPARLIVLGRFPLPGRCKTRLIPALGATNAARCQQRLTEHVVEAARSAAEAVGADVEFRYADGGIRAVRRWLGGGIRYTPQDPGDIGRRMHRSLRAAFANGCERVVLTGSDLPALTPATYAEALAALVNHDVVLGPAADGGYYLIGLRRPANLFDNIIWSTPTVFAETLARARQAGLSTALLPTLSDVDRPADLAGVDEAFKPGGPYVSVIIPALNEADRIEAAVHSAQCDDAEIIVVDGGSIDRTVQIAREAGAETIEAPCGRARQMNTGAQRAKGEILLFLHADTILPPGYLGEVFRIMSDPRVTIGGFRFATDLPGWTMRAIGWLVRLRSEYLRLPYGDQGLFVRAETFRKVGGFADIPIAEDLLLVRRLGRMGRVTLSRFQVQTSGRRWKRLGLVTTTLVNQGVVVASRLGISPQRLAQWYRRCN